MPILNIRAEIKNDKGEVIAAPEILAGSGPVIPVTITLSDEAQHAFIDRGEKPPEAVTGFALIDTGANTTCFDEASARLAGLPTVGVTNMASASHANHEVPLFAGKIIAPTLNINVEGGMGANLSAVGKGLVALIGRDLLKAALFTYNGPDGHFSIAL